MGLILTAVASTMSTLSDQYKEFYPAPAMENATLACLGKRHADKWSRNNGNENVISDGSVIAVAGGQVMMIVDQGEIVEISDKPGAFVYDSSSESSIFSGSLGSSLLNAIKTIGRRISFGGDSARDQRIVYINTMEVKGNTFGGKVAFTINDPTINFRMTANLRCSGMFSFRVCNPILFVQNVCRVSFDNEYPASALTPTLESEFKNALQPAFSRMSAKGLTYEEIAGKTVELAAEVNEVLSAEWREKRGIEVVSISFNSINLPDDQLEELQKAQRLSVNLDPTRAAANLIAAQVDAMRDSANNQGGAGGFVGVNLAQAMGGLGGANAASLMAMGANNNAQAAPAANAWKCACGASNTSKFCSECGKPQPAPAGSWTCECGASNTGKFCAECGKPKPAGAYKCNKCGWTPADGAAVPKFCPECGDVFDSNDIVG